MPVAGLFTTEAIQRKLMYGIQDVIVRTGDRVHDARSLFGIILAVLDLIGVAYRLWKLEKPTHNNVNQYNSHTMIDLRDWFLAHDRSSRSKFYEAFFNLVIIKYDFDGHMGKRLEKWLEKWYEAAQDGKWLFTHKHPATKGGKKGAHTEWVLDETDKNDPAVKRQEALLKALNAKEFDKVLNLIE